MRANSYDSTRGIRRMLAIILLVVVTGGATALAIDPPELLSPVNASVRMPFNPTLRWVPTTPAEEYHVQISSDSIFTKIIFEDSTVADSAKSTPLQADTRYWWRVRAVNPGNPSAWSEVWWFVTVPDGIRPVPGPVVLVYPNDSAEFGLQSVTFYWRSTSPVATRYWFELSSDSMFLDPIVVDTTLADTITFVGSFPRGGRYWWRVKGGDESEWGDFRTIRTFTITNEVSTVELLNREIVRDVSIIENLPNPFNSVTSIRFYLPRGEHTTIRFYDMLGNETAIIRSEFFNEGYHTVTFDASRYASGDYFIRVSTPSFSKALPVRIVK